MYDSKYITPFQYLGGKYSVLNWLLPNLIDTYSFVDLFGGSACVILNKKQSKINTYNDLNFWVVNFFKVLRDQPNELIRQIELTPHSHKEYYDCWMNPALGEVENARRFFTRVRQSFLSTGCQNETKGWLATVRESRASMSEATSKWLNSVSGLEEIVKRLRQIQIENRPYDWILNTYDTADTLFYCDPPYDPEKRSSNSDYTHDFTQEDHIKLHDALSKCTGYFAVSGYNSQFMMDLYSDFRYIEGPQRRNNFSKKENVRECLWTNYDPELSIRKQQSLF